MRQQSKLYPTYLSINEKINTDRAMLTLDYEQILEIANVFYFINEWASMPWWKRLFRSVLLTGYLRGLHKTIHDSCINCCLSLEAVFKQEKDGGPNVPQ